jgi:hypothetical protein
MKCLSEDVNEPIRYVVDHLDGSFSEFNNPADAMDDFRNNNGSKIYKHYFESNVYILWMI